MKEENGGNIDSNYFVGRKLLRKIRGEGKRKFVVIIWREGENRGKERGIRAVFAPRQAVCSSKLYLMLPIPATLPCFLSSILYTNHAHSLHLVHASGKLSLLFAPQINHCSLPRFFPSKSINQSFPSPSLTNQAIIFYSLAIFHFIVWWSKNHQSYFYLGCWETNQPIKSPSIADTVQICTCFARLWCGQKVRNLTFTYGSFGNLIIKNHPVSRAMTGLEVNLVVNQIVQKWEIRLLPRILRKVNLVQNMAISLTQQEFQPSSKSQSVQAKEKRLCESQCYNR